jgi:hypothetical protein
LREGINSCQNLHIEVTLIEMLSVPKEGDARNSHRFKKRKSLLPGRGVNIKMDDGKMH